MTRDITDFFEHLQTFVEDIADGVARLTVYERSFGRSPRLNQSLAVLFAELLQYFRWLRTYLSRPRSNFMRRLILIHDLQQAAKSRRQQLERLCQRAEKDAQLAALETTSANQDAALYILRGSGQWLSLSAEADFLHSTF